MQVDVRADQTRPGYFRIVPHGAIDTETHDGFRSALEPVLAKSPRGIVIDLADVTYISSAGLGVLFSLKKTQDKTGAKLLFCNARPQIAKLFETARFLPTDSVFKSLEEADRYFYEVMNEEIERQKKRSAEGS